jgi:uncharacterized RDD family membrane protein YckC
MPYCKNCGSELPQDAVFCQNCGTPIKGPMRPRYTIASWGERFVAWLIDMIIISVLLSPLTWYLNSIVVPWQNWMPYLRPLINLGPNSVVYFLYWMVMEGMYGQSLGKMALKLKVTRLYWMVMEGMYGQSLGKMALKLKVTRFNEQPIDLGLAAIESIGKAFLLPLDCLIGWIMYSGKNQRLFNGISNTKVVKVSTN